jgi:hypothetical protein
VVARLWLFGRLLVREEDVGEMGYAPKSAIFPRPEYGVDELAVSESPLRLPPEKYPPTLLFSPKLFVLGPFLLGVLVEPSLE